MAVVICCIDGDLQVTEKMKQIKLIDEMIRMDTSAETIDLNVKKASIEFMMKNYKPIQMLARPKMITALAEECLLFLDELTWPELRCLLLDILKLSGDEKTNSYEVVCAYIASRYMIDKSCEISYYAHIQRR